MRVFIYLFLHIIRSLISKHFLLHEAYCKLTESGGLIVYIYFFRLKIETEGTSNTSASQ
jgi:hypothetical protein